MSDILAHCWHCASPLTAADFSREGVCPLCGRYTHVCRNCRFYRPGMHNDCQEPLAEPVADKSRANFCDYFSPNPAPPAANTADTPDQLRAAAEALFDSGDN